MYTQPKDMSMGQLLQAINDTTLAIQAGKEAKDYRDWLVEEIVKRDALLRECVEQLEKDAPHT
jgi:hypothetical protein